MIAIEQGLVSVTHDMAENTMTFRYEPGTPYMVNECIAWAGNAREVAIYVGPRIAHRYRRTSPAMWTDAISAYVDDAFEPRACDRCGKTYQGPAVYCSLECAVADA
ncbi:MAG TPA: hypothetical protein VGR63_19065 [Casimicrobiaceae bacterium]|jgi:hypothetical protein|nr:hypothetical protein [Casimicrobiaceae bacterium]